VRLNKNATLFRALSSDADALSTELAKGRFPVILRPLSERRRVTSVDFRPLLVDAMLTTHPQGFRILFNSNGENAAELRKRFEDESPDHLLAPRLRFSLAHELAHTLFYDLSDYAPIVSKRFRSGGGRTSLENLERTCNKLASHLLLPTPMLKTAIRNMKSITPAAILELAERAGVSVEVLIRRLDETNSALVERYFRGCILMAKQSRDEVSVCALAKPQHLNIANGLRLMRPGERWSLLAHDGSPIELASLLRTSCVRLTISTQYSDSQRDYDVATLRVGRFNSVESYLVTFEER
jgi:IrrE N-terminal-like domain